MRGHVGGDPFRLAVQRVAVAAAALPVREVDVGGAEVGLQVGRDGLRGCRRASSRSTAGYARRPAARGPWSPGPARPTGWRRDSRRRALAPAGRPCRLAETTRCTSPAGRVVRDEAAGRAHPAAPAAGASGVGLLTAPQVEHREAELVDLDVGDAAHRDAVLPAGVDAVAVDLGAHAARHRVAQHGDEAVAALVHAGQQGEVPSCPGTRSSRAWSAPDGCRASPRRSPRRRSGWPTPSSPMPCRSRRGTCSC